MKKQLCIYLLLLFSSSLFGQIAFNLGTTYEERATDISRDESDNIYMTGVFRGDLDLDPGMGQVIVSATGDPTSADSQDVFLVKYDRFGDFVWGFSIGSPGKDMSFSIETKGGFVYVCGSIQGKVDFDPAASIAEFDSGDGQNAFVAAYDTLGAFLWAQVLGDEEGGVNDEDDPRLEWAYDLTVDETGNVYLAGAFDGIIDFEPNSSSPFDSFISVSDQNGVPSQDIFVVSYDPAGNYRWGFGIGGEEREQALSITYRQGLLYLGGRFEGQSDLDPSGLQANVVANGGYDAFLSSYQASDGTFGWGQSWGGSGRDEVGQSCIDFNLGGQIYVGGTFEASVDFDPSGNGQAISSFGVLDVYVSRFSQGGNYLSTDTEGGAGDEIMKHLAVDEAGAVYAGGSTDGQILLYKRNFDRTLRWFYSLGSPMPGPIESQALEGMTLSQAGDVYFVGAIQGNVDVDPGLNSFFLNSEGGNDAFLLRFTPEGELGIFGTSVNPGLEVSDARLFPNPARDFVKLELDWEKSVELNLSIWDIFGRKLWQQSYGLQMGSQSYEIGLDEFSRGIYILKAESRIGSSVWRLQKD